MKGKISKKKYYVRIFDVAVFAYQIDAIAVGYGVVFYENYKLFKICTKRAKVRILSTFQKNVVPHDPIDSPRKNRERLEIIRSPSVFPEKNGKLGNVDALKNYFDSSVQ